ncbi:MAG: GGDEF domain-containing protein [Gemmatimonadaceae bacterium]
MTATIEQALPSHLRQDVQASVERQEAVEDLRFLDGFLEDIRDQMGAEEVVFWQWGAPEEGTEGLVATAWSSPEGGHPSFFRVPDWGPLVQWAYESEAVQTGGEAVHPVLVAAPVRVGDATIGALSVSRGAGIELTRQQAREWLPRHAARVGALLDLFAVRRDFGRSMRQGQALFGAVERIHSHATAEELAAELCATAVEVTSATASALVRWRPGALTGEVLHVHGSIGASPGLRVTRESIVGALVGSEELGDQPPAKPVIADARHLRAGSVFGPGDRLAGPGTVGVISVGQRGRTVGALVIAAPVPDSIGREEAQNLRLLSTVAAAALEISWGAADVAQRALTDGLTGLGNRRYFDDELKRMLDETDRFGRSSTLVLVDLDHFKLVNDTHGHEAGDAVLRQVARILQEGVRTVDRVSRYGGEELALLLPQTPAEGAAELAERLRNRIEAERVIHRGVEIAVTASFGIASYPEPVRTKRGLFPAADAALYEAKAGGRNCVRVASGSGEPRLT